jgi:uncharacterized protein
MNAVSNKLMVKSIFEAIARGERTAFSDAAHDDLIMHVMGESSWSITVKGKTKILVDYFGYVRTRLTGRNAIKPICFFADDDWVIMEAKGEMVALDGRPYQNCYCLHYRIENSKIIEMKEYMDTVLCEDRLGLFPCDLKIRLQDEV